MSNIVTLDEVRAHLRYPIANTQDDAALQFHIDAADDAIRKECGEILPQTYDEYYDGGRKTIFLNQVPVIDVEGVQENWGFAVYNLDNIQPDATGAGSMFAYSIDNAGTGEITRRTSGGVVIPFMRGKANIRITYTTGREPVPALIKLAELELIAYWWQNSQQRASQQATSSGFGAVDQGDVRSGPEAGIQSINLGIPWRIIEMLKAYRSGPILG